MTRLLLCLALFFPPTAALAAPAPQEAPKTIVLGFDGMDHALTSRWIDEGHLPNLARLAQQGALLPLLSSNPAESNVAWAVANTGQNPGKTGVPGFVGRNFRRDADGQPTGSPMPQLMLGDQAEVPADDYVTFPMALQEPRQFAGLAALAALAALLLVLKILRLPTWLAVVLGLGGGGGAFWMAMDHAAALPAHGKVPYVFAPVQSDAWWTHLDAQGIRVRGVQLASTYPPDDEGPNTTLLAGLGVTDVGGSPGSWFIYTNDPWMFPGSLPSGGESFRLSFDLPDPGGNPDSRAAIDLPGPRNWVVDARYQTTIQALSDKVNHPDNTAEEAALWKAEHDAVDQEYKTWKRNGQQSKARFTVDLDRGARTVTIQPEKGGAATVLKAGEWSDFVPVTYRLNEAFAVHGSARFHVMRLDDEEVRLFVPPVNFDPLHPPEIVPISSPPEFAKQLAEGIGRRYETLGWACMTNPLKSVDDTHFTPQSFMDDIVQTMQRREDLLAYNLDRPGEWDVYYQVFSTSDRVGHMLMREMDPGHPKYDEAYASSTVDAYGRTFALKDALRECYKEVDRIVGGVLARIEAGEFGGDCLLVTVADHGFASFRRGVNLNNLLHELGYLVTKDGRPLSDFSGPTADLLQYVDWKKTRAYSLGLGTIYVNLDGREPDGIVAPADYEATVEAIRQDLLAVTDGEGGPKVFSQLWRRDEVVHGPWAKEGKADRRRRQGARETVEHDGYFDLIAGFAPPYRVSWNNSLGGIDATAIHDNTQHWSGDHVSVDPALVPGAFFCNRPVPGVERPALVDLGPTLLARYGVDPEGKDMDGRVLPIEGLRE